jgi:phosphoribosylformylglycinamidine synthase
MVLLLGGGAGGRPRGIHGLGGSEYLVRKLGKVAGSPPHIDLAAEAKLQKLVLELARERLLQSAHDVSEGGIGVTLAECCATAPSSAEDVGARIDFDDPANPVEALALFFGEDPSRVVVSARPGAPATQIIEKARAAGVPVVELGVTGGHSLSIAFSPKHGSTPHAAAAFQVPLAKIREARERCLEPIVGA